MHGKGAWVHSPRVLAPSLIVQTVQHANRLFLSVPIPYPIKQSGELDVVGASAGILYENVPRACLKHHEVVDLLQVFHGAY